MILISFDTTHQQHSQSSFRLLLILHLLKFAEVEITRLLMAQFSFGVRLAPTVAKP